MTALTSLYASRTVSGDVLMQFAMEKRCIPYLSMDDPEGLGMVLVKLPKETLQALVIFLEDERMTGLQSSCEPNAAP